jgi:SagB-type dehydrogenase family enzyme
LRLLLKGYAGDWRDAPDSRRGAPKPPETKPVPADAATIRLVSPDDLDLGRVPLAEAIANRRSRRSYNDESLTLKELSFLLWSTQGVTATIRDGAGRVQFRFRAAPSGGALYPLETYLFVNRVDGVEPGVYRYAPHEHVLVAVRPNEQLSGELQAACYGQQFIGSAAVVFAWTAVPYRTEWKYGFLAHRMIAMEAGHVCQNLYLACESIGAGACAVCGYHQPLLDEMLQLDGEDEFTIYLAAVGKIARDVEDPDAPGTAGK